MRQSNAGRLTYERPEIRFWSADELDAIQATMSGGGGGSSGGGGSGSGSGSGSARLKWGDVIIDEGYENIVSFVIDVVMTTLAVIVTKGAGTLEQVGAGLLGNAAADIISSAFPGVYYVRKVRYLYIYSGTAMGGYEAWDYVGYATRTSLFADDAHSVFIDTVDYAEIPSAYSYMRSSLTWA